MPSAEGTVPTLRPAASRLFPREHGAYAQLAFPMLSVLMSVRWNVAVAGLTVAIVALFLAHEPLLILLGHRGPRAKQQWVQPARFRLAWLLTLGLAGGLLFVTLADHGARLAMLIPVVLGLGAPVLVAARREKSTVGEVWIAITLACTSVPVAVAGGLPVERVLIVAATWSSLFAMSTFAVRVVIASTRKERTVELRLLGITCAVLAPIAIVHWGGISTALFTLAAGPVSLITIALCVKPLHARYLRPIGWTVAGACTWGFLILPFVGR